MIELLRNSFHSIDLFISYNDIPSSAANPTYILKDYNTNQVIRSGSASTVSEDIGHYQIQITSQDTSIDRVLQVTWNYVLAGVQTTESEILSVSTTYASISEILDELEISIDITDPRYFPVGRLYAAERMARLQINSYVGHTFGQRAGNLYVNGTDKSILTLPERMISISRLEQNDEIRYDVPTNFNNLGYGLELTETNMAIKIIDTSGDGLIYYPNTGVNPPLGIFPSASRFKVTGVIGYPYIPMEVTQAAILLINDHLYNDGLWHARYVDRIHTGEMQIRIRDAAFRGTGNLLADNLLEKYKNINIVAI